MLHLFAKNNRGGQVQEAFRKYLKATRGFWKVARRCATKVSPDQRLVLQKAIRLQLLLIDRTARFSHLLESETFDWTKPKSLGDVSERLDEGWSENEEADLIEVNSLCRKTLDETKNIKTNWDAELLDEPIRELGRSAKFTEARRVVADRVTELAKRLRG